MASVVPTNKMILDAAYVLFRKRGYHRVSLDEIAAAAEVTKRTLYYHFGSKDALLTAMLAAQSKVELSAFQTFGVQLSGTPEEIVEKLFTEVSIWSSKSGWVGSGFTRLVVELVDLPGHPAHEIARRHKAALEQYLAQLLANAGVSQPIERSREIFLLLEGAINMILIHRDQRYAVAAGQAARRLLQSPASNQC